VVINHLNFNRQRISPYFTQNISVGADLYKQEQRTIRFQSDIANVSNTLELIDFGGLFSGNAVGPGRQYTFRLVATF
jgi:outer membrane receptor for Fe3+-dicitrate